MTYRGIYRGGVVVLEGDVDLADGASVDVNLSQGGRIGRIVGGASKEKKRGGTKGKKAAKVSKRAKSVKKLPGFGIWKDRWPESMSSAEVARELRENVSRRRG